jgi:hypothetical protein
MMIQIPEPGNVQRAYRAVFKKMYIGIVKNRFRQLCNAIDNDKKDDFMN